MSCIYIITLIILRAEKYIVEHGVVNDPIVGQF